MKPNPQIRRLSSPRLGRATRLFALATAFSVAGLAGPAVAGAVPSGADASAHEVRRIADRPADRPDDRPDDHKIEQLRLNCNVRQANGHSAIGCHWSAPTSDHAAGVRLQRIVVGSGHGRQTVYRSEDLGVTDYLDTEVREGHRYVYAVQALNHDGRVIGMSRPVNIGIRPNDPPVDPPAIEVLGINCFVADVDPPNGRAHIGCEWRLPEAGTARLLTLWRSVDGGEREQVAGFTHPFETSYRDVVPAGTHRVAYAVIATDGEGHVVARSRATTLAISHDRPTPSTSIVPAPGNPETTDPVETEPGADEPVPPTTPVAVTATTAPERTDEDRSRRDPTRPHDTRPDRPDRPGHGAPNTRPGQTD